MKSPGNQKKTFLRVDFGVLCSHIYYQLLDHASQYLDATIYAAWVSGEIPGLESGFWSMKQIISKFINRAENLENRVDLGRLTRLIRRYTVEQQQVPKELTDLVELNYLTVLPAAPQGQRFIIDRRRVEVRLE